MPSCSCRKKPLRLPGFRECVNTTSVSVCKRVHRPRINFARDRDSRIETGGRMKYSRERPKYWGRARTRTVDEAFALRVLPRARQEALRLHEGIVHKARLCGR